MFKRQPDLKRPKSSKRSSTSKKVDSNQSSIKFLWCNIAFTTEPLWFRLTVIILLLLMTAFIIWALKVWAAPAYALQKLSHLKQFNIVNFFKNKN